MTKGFLTQNEAEFGHEALLDSIGVKGQFTFLVKLLMFHFSHFIL